MVERNVVKGRAHDALPDIKRKVCGYMSRAERVYVGATTNVRRRAAQHAERKPWARRMVVLYESDYRGSARTVEKELIAWARDTGFMVEHENVRGGGEGLHSEFARHAVYVLLDR